LSPGGAGVLSVLTRRDQALAQAERQHPHLRSVGPGSGHSGNTRLQGIWLVAILEVMNEVTRILSAIERGEPHAAEELLPLVYHKLRQLAAEKMAQEKPGQTLQATALVHEAYLRLVGKAPDKHWDHRGHFFAAAAEAMRRILVERARSKQRLRHGGGAARIELQEGLAAEEDRGQELIEIHEALTLLERHDAQAAALVKLRFFAGLEHQEAAEMLGISRRAADRLWLLARTWLYQTLKAEPE
jgi:RNA polymerase sigma factor (TIGR02999 family)